MKGLHKHLLIVLIFSFTLASAQNNNSILWEINGNGLKKPSYLFGSIHITDKKVFNFPDSVLAKLKQCETAAFELNLDSVSGMMLENAIKQAKKRKVDEILSKNEMAKLKKELKKKNISIDNIDNEVPLNLYNRYNESLRKKDKKDMSTFLDGYLFRIAHLYGKDIIGIETYEEQMNAFDNMQDDDQKKLLMSMADSTYNPREYMDSLVSLYIRQDVKGLYTMVSGVSAGDFENIVLIKRNYVMDRRIDSLIQRRSAFICVGAGHLSGTEGLIALLSKRGYTVKPLYSPKTGYYKTLLPAENTDNWKTIIEENGGYQLKMPGEPTPLNMYGLEMKGYMDLGTGHFYLSTSFPRDEKQKSSNLMDAMVKKLAGSGELLSKKSIKYNSMQGYEIELKMAKTTNSSVRVLSDTANIYLLMIGIGNGNPDKNSVTKFFNSLVSIKRTPSKDIIFKEDTAAFEINVPSTFKMTENENREDIKYKTYSCLDYSSKAIITATYIDYGSGRYFPDVNKMYESVFEPVKAALGAEPVYMHDSALKEYKCRDYKILASDGSTLFARYILRCSRLYILTASSKNQLNEADVYKRFSSFHFLTPLKLKLQSYTSSEKDFTVMMPGPVQQETDSLQDEKINYTYGASDVNTSNWFKIYSHQFSEYDYLKNDSAIFNYFKNYAATINDSIVDSSKSENGTIKMYNFELMRNTNTDVSKKVRVVMNGRHFYLLIAINDLVNPNDSINENLFNSFKIAEPD
ncbi:MAG TPA: TraB/GumN family protein, partial [Bacteroidia bacterium]|nr:TraB/GumN family protein [Bacteroidia bacterium]